MFTVLFNAFKFSLKKRDWFFYPWSFDNTALKKSNYLNEEGKYIEPDEPNVYKFEAFIFDAFERYDGMSILRVKREDEFAPVKNAEGVDSPETARNLYNNKYMR